MDQSENPMEYELKILKDQLASLTLITDNLIHEIEILKQALFLQGTLAPSHWHQCFLLQKKQFLGEKKGAILKQMQRYSNDEQSWREEFSVEKFEKEK